MKEQASVCVCVCISLPVWVCACVVLRWTLVKVVGHYEILHLCVLVVDLKFESILGLCTRYCWDGIAEYLVLLRMVLRGTALRHHAEDAGNSKSEVTIEKKNAKNLDYGPSTQVNKKFFHVQ